ncbi:MAG: hypothetical protein Q9162_002244 [Coniocarpon cinnabarinum]
MSATKLNINSTLPLPNTTLTTPRLGFGITYRALHIVSVRLNIPARPGYRKIDSAQYYQNEQLVADAVAQSGMPREQLFLTTKQLSPAGSVDATYARVADSVRKLGGSSGYIDLMLIHTASGGPAARKTLWQAFERAHQEGKCKAIGVSNFGIGAIEELKSFAKVWPPHVNQVELHPWHQQREVVDYCQKNGIAVEAYCPLVRGMKNKDPTLVSIANKHGKDPGQVLVRYCLQKDWSPLPKSDTPSRIVSNAEVFGWELDADDMKKLDDCDQGSKGAIVETVRN